MTLAVREATVADLDAIERIEHACFPHDTWSRESLAYAMARAGGVAWVAAHGGSVVGFGLGVVGGDVLDVLQVAVDPSLRRMGVGRALVGALHDAVRHVAREAILEVRVDNGSAIAMYRACGYEDIHVRRRYYADGCDARVMRRTLADPPLSSCG
jgi:ribosomal-protein-alanine N-acetyltransferase